MALDLTSSNSFPIIQDSNHNSLRISSMSLISGNGFLMKQKLIMAIWVFLLSLVSGCLSQDSDFSARCEERQALFCEDFEGIDPTLGGNQLVTSTAYDQWWITSDDDHEFLFQGFPQFGRTRNNLILLSDGLYKDSSASFLYTREIDLRSATRASLNFNLIYRTEQHWDGLVVFAITDGVEGVKNPQNWVMLTPREGYPDSVLLNGSLIPGYSGISAGWTHQEVDLSTLLGEKLILGFYFVSDAYLGEWGIGLDDIVVEADLGKVAGQSVGLTTLAIDTLIFPHNPMISPDLPRANPLTDAACIGSEEDLPDLSERAIIKAISEAGDHVLVLNPGARSLCWVRQEDIWIDGDPTKLPRLSEKALANYLPISSMSHTPVLTETNCLTGNESPLPIQLQAALVDNGKIITMIFESSLPTGIDIAPIDPRIGSSNYLPDLQPDYSPGGEMWIEIEGRKTICLSDWNQPGRVICQGLSLDISRHLGFEVCWQGWTESQSCPIGYLMDAAGAICVPVDESIGCSINCMPGYYLDDQSETCLVDKRKDSLLENQDSCPPGFLYNTLSGNCQGQEYLLETNCPPGTYFVTEQNQCLILGERDGCPEGFFPLADPKGCIPVNLFTTPHCKEFDIQFPKSEVTVKESTRCLIGPGNSNEIVSSLKPFDSVEVLGLGEDGETLVINNPIYQIPCWAPLDDFYLDKLDLKILPIISSGESD